MQILISQVVRMDLASVKANSHGILILAAGFSKFAKC